MRLLPLALSLALAACATKPGPCGRPAVPVPALSTPAAPAPAPLAAADEARLAAIATRLDALSAEFIAFWKTHGPDPKHGGFHGTLDRQGKPISPTDKGLIQQSRHLWSLSLWYERRERTPEIKALADAQYRFLTEHFLDRDGEFFFKVNEAGTPLDRKKVLYAEGFAIYALTQYARSFGVAAANTQALTCFRSLDARAHDAKFGGYDQRNDAPWLTPGASKETNTHLHLLEAFTTLYAATHDPLVLARVEELLRLFTDRIVQPGHYAAKDFLSDWQPFGAPAVSYGHDIETAWLLLESARVLGFPNDARVRDAALAIGANSAKYGFDAQHGGYFEEGPPAGAPIKVEKIWWIQAEAIPGLYALYALSGDRVYLDRLERTLDHIEQHQRDREFGGWYWGVLADGSVGPRGANKGEEWKASYHELRALVFVADWIRSRPRTPPVR